MNHNVIRRAILEEIKSEEVIQALELLHEHYRNLSGTKAAAFSAAVLSTVLGVAPEPFDRRCLAAIIMELALTMADAMETHKRGKLSEVIAANLNKTLFAKIAPTCSGRGFAVMAREYADSPWVQIDALVEQKDAEQLVVMMQDDDYARRAYIASLRVDEDWGDYTAVLEEQNGQEGA